MMTQGVILAGVAVVLAVYMAWLRRVNPGLQWVPWRETVPCRPSGLPDLPLPGNVLVEQLADALTGFFWVMTPDLSRVYYVSPSFESFTGYSTDSLYDDPGMWRKLVHPDHSERIAQRSRPPDHAEAVGGEFKFVRADGSSGWAWVRMQPVADQQGVVVARLGIVADISKRKELEQALKTSEGNYRNVVENANDGILIEQDDRPKFVNPRMAEMLGYRPEEIEGQPFEMLLPTSMREWLTAMHRRREQGLPEPARYEVALQHKDGRTVDVEINVSRMEYDGRPAFLAFVHDLSERKRVEVALLRSEERYRSLFEESPVGLWEEDFSKVKAHLDDMRAQGIDDFRAYFDAQPDEVGRCMALVQVLDVNRTTLKMTRAIDKAVVLANLKREQPPEAVALMREQLIAVAENRLSFSGEGVGLTVDGDELDIRLTWSVVSGHEDTLSKVIVSVEDVTDRKRAEAEREHLIVELNAFGRTVAHDLKTPLTAIMGYTEMLTDEFDRLSEAEIREFLWIIGHDSGKMSRIIDELMLLASVRDLSDIHVRPLDMGLIVTSALGRLGYMIKERDAAIALPQEAWPLARGYAPWVEEVWANYLSNAIKYGGEPLHIEVGADAPRDGMVRFWVHDNGPGIAPDDVRRLFTEFTRLDELRAQGHGLGLSIVQRIIEKLGGTVDVVSKPGEGSTFGFSLPAVEK